MQAAASDKRIWAHEFAYLRHDPSHAQALAERLEELNQ